MKGTVRKIVFARGFGFIEMPSGPDAFMHFRWMKNPGEFSEELVGRQVEFDAVRDPKGIRAMDVKVLPQE